MLRHSMTRFGLPVMLASFAGAGGAVLLLSASIGFFSLFLRQVFVHDNFLLNGINTGLAKQWGFVLLRGLFAAPSQPFLHG